MDPIQSPSTDLGALLARLASLEAEVYQLRTVQARRRSRWPGRLLRAALIAAVCALLLGSTASASIPSSGTFSACYRTAGSMNLLYILNADVQSTCPGGMSKTTWSQSGGGVGTIFMHFASVSQQATPISPVYVGFDGESSTTATDVTLPMPASVTLSHLYGKLETAQSLIGTTFSIGLYDATTSTIIPTSCIFTGIVSSGTTCTDVGTTAIVAAGDAVCYILSVVGPSNVTPGPLVLSVEAA